MRHPFKFLSSLAVSALTCALLAGFALAVPLPTLPHSDSEAAQVTATDGTTAQSNVSWPDGSRGSRSKAKYWASGLILAALATPAVLNWSSNSDDRSFTVLTKPPQPASAGESGTPDLGTMPGDDIPLDGRGGISDRDNDKGNGGNGNGGNDQDKGDLNDHSSEGGDGGGDCDDGGDKEGGRGGEVGDSGGDDGGSDASTGGLLEPGTVPLIGAGILVALAFRRRR